MILNIFLEAAPKYFPTLLPPFARGLTALVSGTRNPPPQVARPEAGRLVQSADDPEEVGVVVWGEKILRIN